MPELSVAGFLAQLLLILVSAKLFGELAARLRQPAVLGELLGGVVLGFGLVPFFKPGDQALALMAELGVVLLLFETGLHSDLEELLGVGPSSAAVAVVGVAAPFVLGWSLMTALGHGPLTAVFTGAAMTATSVGITARALSDLGALKRPEARVILGAAVIDDVLGIIILAAVQGIALAGAVEWKPVLRTTVLSAGFLVAALTVGPRLSAALVGLIRRMRVGGVLIVGAVCFAFACALLAELLGTALIVGAFTAGALLSGTDRKEDIAGALKPLTDVFVPIFFVMVGARVHLDAYNPLAPGAWPMLAMAAGMIVLAVAGKLASGWGALDPKLNRLAIGVGMIPRGEVGLIFAQIGLSSAIIGDAVYAAIVAMVVATTFVAPPLLKRALAR